MKTHLLFSAEFECKISVFFVEAAGRFNRREFAKKRSYSVVLRFTADVS